MIFKCQLFMCDECCWRLETYCSNLREAKAEALAEGWLFDKKKHFCCTSCLLKHYRRLYPCE